MVYTTNRSEMDALRSALHERMAGLVIHLYGEPNRRLSSRRDWRYGTHGSLSIVVAGPNVGGFYDHERGCGGDVFGLIALRLGLEFLPAKEWAAKFVGGSMATPLPTFHRPTLSAANDNNKEVAERIWRQSVEPTGTVVEAYLASRKLPIPAQVAGAVIRFHGSLAYEGMRTPGMVALMRDLHSNEPCAIHRTFLTRDGAKLSKKMLGRAKGAAIKLSADEQVHVGLHVGEGIETCMSWMRLGFEPTWALGSAGAVAAFPVLSGIEALTILMETDAASARAMAACRDRWLAHGREVNTVTPTMDGDGNDVLMKVA